MSRSNSIYTEDIEMYPTHNEQHLTREYTKPDGQTKSDDKVDPTQQITAETKAPYTLLSYGQKWGMVAILNECAGFWSSLGSPIYYPALRQLEKQFNVDENMLTLLWLCLLFQGISPTVSGGLADCFGRRPIILAGMLIYVIASIGLACCSIIRCYYLLEVYSEYWYFPHNCNQFWCCRGLHFEA